MMHWKNLYSVGSYFILKDSLSRDNGAMCQKTGKKVEDSKLPKLSPP